MDKTHSEAADANTMFCITLDHFVHVPSTSLMCPLLVMHLLTNSSRLVAHFSDTDGLFKKEKNVSVSTAPMLSTSL